MKARIRKLRSAVVDVGCSGRTMTVGQIADDPALREAALAECACDIADPTTTERRRLELRWLQAVLGLLANPILTR